MDTKNGEKIVITILNNLNVNEKYLRHNIQITLRLKCAVYSIADHFVETTAAGFEVAREEMTATNFYFSRLLEAKRIA